MSEKKWINKQKHFQKSLNEFKVLNGTQGSFYTLQKFSRLKAGFVTLTLLLFGAMWSFCWMYYPDHGRMCDSILVLFVLEIVSVYSEGWPSPQYTV